VKPLSAILFGLLLVWAQVLATPMPMTYFQPAHACCRCGGKMSCCAPSSPASQPVSALPSRSVTQHQLSFAVPDSLAWTLPAGPSCTLSFVTSSLRTVVATPLYARDCARLI